MWGRLSTCGGLSTRPCRSFRERPVRTCVPAPHAMRSLPAYDHNPFVATFHARRLPHYYSVGHPLFVTWRLHGSLPANRVFPEAVTSGRAFLAIDRLLDSGRTGPLHLSRPDVANMVVEAIHFRERGLAHYRLHAWVVMANHVHLLITPQVQVSKLMQSLKRFTAREGNRILRVTGSLSGRTRALTD
jgi:putative transposase